MHKQELINKYTDRLNGVLNLGAIQIFSDLINDLKKLDEPKKVQIPQFVASWIEYCKFTHVNLQHALIVGDVYFYNYANQKDFSKLKEFLETENNQATFARAWLDGYEIEKEKRYLVKLKGVFKGYEYLNFKFGRVWTFSNEEENEEYRTCHTKKELEEAGFGWVFDCEGVEVEEVER